MSDDYLPVLRQRLAADLLPAGHDYWDVLDLVPPGPEGYEAQLSESQRRMRSVSVFQPFVEVYATLCADIMTQVVYKNNKQEIDEDDPEQVEKLEEWHRFATVQNRELARSFAYPLLAGMLEANVIKYGGMVPHGVA